MGKGARCKESEGGVTTPEGSEVAFSYVSHVHAAFAVEATGVKVCCCMLLLSEAPFSFN